MYISSAAVQAAGCNSSYFDFLYFFSPFPTFLYCFCTDVNNVYIASEKKLNYTPTLHKELQSTTKGYQNINILMPSCLYVSNQGVIPMTSGPINI